MIRVPLQDPTSFPVVLTPCQRREYIENQSVPFSLLRLSLFSVSRLVLLPFSYVYGICSGFHHNVTFPFSVSWAESPPTPWTFFRVLPHQNSSVRKVSSVLHLISSLSWSSRRPLFCLPLPSDVTPFPPVLGGEPVFHGCSSPHYPFLEPSHQTSV